MTIEPFWVQINESTLRQGDYLPGCLVPIPVFDPTTFGEKDNETKDVEIDVQEFDLIVVTQSCDLDNKKVNQVILCPIFPIVEYEVAKECICEKRQVE